MALPLVSIWMITYNHEKYIAQAIESVLMQDTNFDFEIVIGEDCSTDHTRQIVKDFEKKYPEIIHAIYHEKNVGANRNAFEFTLPQCRGKYIALCEGDDFWTDPKKLQKQVDFMESNSEFTCCYHNAQIKFEGVRGKDHLFNSMYQKDTLVVQDIINGIRIPTASMLYRNEALEIPEWINQIYNGDLALRLLLASKGNIKYIDQVMSVYRVQQGGLNSTMRRAKIQQHVVILLSYFNFFTNFKYKKHVDERIENIFEEYPLVLLADKSRLQRIFSLLYWKRRFAKIIHIFINT